MPIGQVLRAPSSWPEVPRALILGNGDVQNLRDAHRRIRETHVDGVLIGRGAQGDPWLFREKDRVKEALQSNGDLSLNETAIR